MNKYAVIDIETTGLSKFEDKINLIGVYYPEVDKYTIIKDNWSEELQEAIKGRKTILHNGKFDSGFILEKTGYKLYVDIDTMMMAYLTLPNIRESFGLKKLAMKYVGADDWDVDMDTKTGVTEETINYLKGDLWWTWKLYEYFRSKMSDDHIRLMAKLLIPTLNTYIGVENRGIYLQIDRLDELKIKLDISKTKEMAELKKTADINFNSSMQLRKVLFEQLGLPIGKLTKSGSPSTGKDVLKKLAPTSPFCETLLKYKDYNKQLEFINKWKLINVNSRLFPHFNLTTTATGRTSSSDPNIQQVPRNKDVRSLFTAPKGFTFVNADYSQVELRIAGVIADVPEFIEAYKNDQDLHTLTAQQVSGKEEITYQERTSAKAINFGFLYGMMEDSFQDYAYTTYGLKLTKEEAREFRAKFFRSYPSLAKWHKWQVEIFRSKGGSTNLFKRFRPLPDLNSRDWFKKSSDERRAINTPVQSTASDIVLSGLTEIYETLVEKEYKGKLYIVGTVHDSIMFEIADDILDEVLPKIKNIMEHPTLLKYFKVDLKGVPLKVDIEAGAWGVGKEILF